MERVASLLSNNFINKKKVTLHIVLFGINPIISFELDKRIVVHTPEFNFNNKFRLFYTLKTICFLRKKIKELKPDSILSLGEKWNNLVLLSLLGLNFPIFISDRSEPNKDLGKFHNILRNLLYPFSSGIIAQTSIAAKIALQKKWNNNISIIGNPFKKESFNKKIKKENIILSVGRLIETKHFDELINIFKNINNKKWKLIIVGGNTNKSDLLNKYRNLVKKLGLTNQIFFEGERNDVRAYYLKSKIFAFTSSSEGFPNAIGEAMSFGIPVIAYDCVAGPSDLIYNGITGYLIKNRNQKKYEMQLKNLMQDDNTLKTFSKMSLEKINDFNIKNISEKYYEFII